MKEPKIALVLSGGASLGFAHVGVLDELIKAGIKPDIIVGTSMGAVVGGAYACGLGIEDMMKYVYKMSLMKFVDINFQPQGAFGGTRVTELLSKIYEDKNISDCICEFATIAVDIDEGTQVIMNSGKVLDAVRASMNIPGLLVPYEVDGRSYIDGGIINNYPDDVAKDMGADIIIGVDVLKNSYSHSKPKNFVVTLFKSLQLLQNTLYEYKELCSDVIIAPDLKQMSMADFKKDSVDYAINTGREEAKKYIQKIKRIIREKKKHIDG